MGSGAKRFWRLSAAASFIALAAFTAPAASNADERPLFVSLGDTARAPVGWIEFCVENPRDCAGRPTMPRDVVLSTPAWKELARDQPVGQQRDQADDRHGTLGRGREWSYPEDGYGDCEDYVLLKRRMLIAGGLAARGAADHRGARQARRRPCRAHREDRQG